MRRVVVLGPGGAGKSVLATRLGERTGLPVIHLDVIFWRPGWHPAPRAQAVDQLAEVVATDAWILEGNFLADVARDGRLGRADTVVLLDLPAPVCIARVMRRLIRDRHRTRPDLPAGCSESFDPEGLASIVHWAAQHRPQVLALMEGLRDGVECHRLRSPGAVRRFEASV